MFINFDRTGPQRIVVTANEGRGSLPSAVIKITHLVSEKLVELEKENLSTKQERYDEFEILVADIEDLEEGDLLYEIYPGEDSDLDSDILLEKGRARITRIITDNSVQYDRTSDEPVIYERQ